MGYNVQPRLFYFWNFPFNIFLSCGPQIAEILACVGVWGHYTHTPTHSPVHIQTHSATPQPTLLILSPSQHIHNISCNITHTCAHTLNLKNSTEFNKRQIFFFGVCVCACVLRVHGHADASVRLYYETRSPSQVSFPRSLSWVLFPRSVHPVY